LRSSFYLNPPLKNHKKLWANLIRPQLSVAKQRSAINTETFPMQREYCIPRILTLELLYPAVLGSVFYTLFTAVSDGTGFLAGSIGDISLKGIIFIVTLAFFSADFVYTTWSPGFRWPFFFLDVFIVTGLYTIFSGTALVSTASPDLDRIAGGFAVILLCYFIWDCCDPAIRQTPILKRHMFIWEAISGSALIVAFSIHRMGYLAGFLASLPLLLVLAASTIYFWLLVLEQRRTILKQVP